MAAIHTKRGLAFTNTLIRCAALLCCCYPAYAAVRMPAILSDHMVLQAGAVVPIWGWAAAGEQVVVRLAGKTASVQADERGGWRVTFDLSTSRPGPVELSVEGKDDTLVISDVLLGEVWLAAGQSNMEMPLAAQPGRTSNRDSAVSVAGANHAQIRLFKVPRKRSLQPAADTLGKWVICSPDSVVATKFSAVAYYFGERLHQQLGVPIALIDSTFGGTTIERWMRGSGDLFNGMVAPLAPFALRGTIWYQGESNVIEDADVSGYANKMEGLIGGWRESWGSKFPFYYVQVAPHLYTVTRASKVTSPYKLPQLWEAQVDAMRIADTAMVVTNDLVSDLGDIHPSWKRPVGLRLANVALARIYGHVQQPVSGPAFRSASFNAQEAEITFAHAEGLAARDGGALTWFEIAGADGIFHQASARILDGKVIVSNPEVLFPHTVRYAWSESAQPNLVNGAGLPASSFRTDHPWPVAKQP